MFPSCVFSCDHADLCADQHVCFPLVAQLHHQPSNTTAASKTFFNIVVAFICFVSISASWCVVGTHLTIMVSASVRSRAINKSIKVCLSLGNEPVLLIWSCKLLASVTSIPGIFNSCRQLGPIFGSPSNIAFNSGLRYHCLSSASDNPADSAAIVDLTTRDIRVL